MWVKDRDSNESYVHVCAGLKEKQMRNKEIEIRLHDVSIFTFIHCEKSVQIEYIKYCPYCGIELKDTVEN